jgi:phage virion morphogenesis protein
VNDLQQLEGWVAPLLSRVGPAARRQLARKIGQELRRSQQGRIGEQKNPDGSAYAPRRAQAKSGRVKRGVMFRKIRQAKHLRLRATADEVSIGFFGRVARIARVHQEGLADQVSRGGAWVRYERRELLGFTEAELARMHELLVEHFGG